MVLEASYLPLVLLLFLTSGSCIQRAEAQKLRRETVGQTFSASCKYPPQRGNSYKSKIWYRKQADKQIWLVSTSKPRELAQNSRYVIWDDPDMGITNVIMTELKGEDTGNYVCAMKNSKGGIVSYKNIFLIVTPATHAFPVMTTAASISGSEHRERKLPSSSSAAPSALWGLLVAKSLVLSALLLLLRCVRWGHKNALGESAKQASDGPPLSPRPQEPCLPPTTSAVPAPLSDYCDPFKGKGHSMPVKGASQPLNP